MKTCSYSPERMLYLLSDAENLIWKEIQSYTDGFGKPKHSIEYIKNMIECYISLSKENNEPAPYHTIKDFFCPNDNENGEFEKEYNKFMSCKSAIQETFEQNKELFWINHIESDICGFIRNVLNDSETDPHFSAVYASNIIKCIIHLMKELGRSLPYSNIKSFFEHNGFTQAEYEAFEENRKKESVYYRGIQY